LNLDKRVRGALYRNAAVKIMDLIEAITQRRELVQNLVARELKARYKGSALGFLWSILTPLFMAAIYVFFLRLLAGRGVPLEEIIIGVFAWQFTSMCVTGGLTAITGNSNLVKKVRFPRVVLPLAVTLANMVNFVLSLLVQFGVILLCMWFRDVRFSSWLPVLPILIAYQTLFNFALAMLMAAANVYFRDTQHLVGVLLSAWFFVSPVMYNWSFVEKAAQQMPWLPEVYWLNPMALIITAYRAATLANVAWPSGLMAGLSAAIPPALFAAAYWVYQRAQRNFADYL
jgi:lipopolysaccharide transport system permease protein